MCERAAASPRTAIISIPPAVLRSEILRVEERRLLRFGKAATAPGFGLFVARLAREISIRPPIYPAPPPLEIHYAQPPYYIVLFCVRFASVGRNRENYRLRYIIPLYSYNDRSTIKKNIYIYIDRVIGIQHNRQFTRTWHGQKSPGSNPKTARMFWNQPGF